jgi:hypothetical protein
VGTRLECSLFFFVLSSKVAPSRFCLASQTLRAVYASGPLSDAVYASGPISGMYCAKLVNFLKATPKLVCYMLANSFVICSNSVFHAAQSYFEDM